MDTDVYEGSISVCSLTFHYGHQQLKIRCVLFECKVRKSQNALHDLRSNVEGVRELTIAKY
jgi:hypothetical protein